MIRTKNNPGLSNLSIVIPRSVHRAAKAKYMQSGAPTFAAYIAALLEQAPDRPTAQMIYRCLAMQYLIAIGKHKDQQPAIEVGA
jgi:hypothetical protein